MRCLTRDFTTGDENQLQQDIYEKSILILTADIDYHQQQAIQRICYRKASLMHNRLKTDALENLVKTRTMNR